MGSFSYESASLTSSHPPHPAAKQYFVMSSINMIAYNCPSCIRSTMEWRTDERKAFLKYRLLCSVNERARRECIYLSCARGAAKAPSLQCSNEFRSIVTTRTISFHQSVVKYVSTHTRSKGGHYVYILEIRVRNKPRKLVKSPV